MGSWSALNLLVNCTCVTRVMACPHARESASSQWLQCAQRMKLHCAVSVRTVGDVAPKHSMLPVLPRAGHDAGAHAARTRPTPRFASQARQEQGSGGRCRRARAVALLTTHCTRSPSPTCTPAGRSHACAACSQQAAGAACPASVCRCLLCSTTQSAEACRSTAMVSALRGTRAAAAHGGGVAEVLGIWRGLPVLRRRPCGQPCCRP